MTLSFDCGLLHPGFFDFDLRRCLSCFDFVLSSFHVCEVLTDLKLQKLLVVASLDIIRNDEFIVNVLFS